MNIFEYFLPLLLLITLVVYTGLQLFFYSFLSVRKRIVFAKAARLKFVRWLHVMPRATLAYGINMICHTIGWTLCIIFCKFWLNIVIAIICLVWLVITIFIIFYRKKIIDFTLKKAKSAKKKNIRFIQKMNKLKFKVDYSDGAVSLYDAFHNCPVLNVNKRFDLNKIYKDVTNLGDCQVEIDDNISESKYLNQCSSLYVTIVNNKGKTKRERFAYIFDIKKLKSTKNERKMLFLLKISPRDKSAIFDKYKRSTPCRYPLGCDFISFPLDDNIPAAVVDTLIQFAYKYTKNHLEQNELNNLGKKINL